MTDFSKSDYRRIAVSALGALAVSATCVLGAVGPARAAAPASVPAWTAAVENRIDAAAAQDGGRLGPVPYARAEVALHFAADGGFAGASLARSTGIASLDREAVALARTLRYPPLPTELRGVARDVTMRLGFGDPLGSRRAQRIAAAAPAAGTELAAR